MDDHDVVVLDRETVEYLQKCAAKRDWKCFREKIHGKKLKDREQLLLEPFDLFENTVLHVVAQSSVNKKISRIAKLLRELLDMLPDETQQKEALTKGNKEGNTLLHEAAINLKKDCLGTVDVIMEFGMKILNQQNGYQELLTKTNNFSETPIFRAARFGNLDMLKHIHRWHQLRYEHFPPSWENGRIRPIILNCLLGFNFGVAIWLMNEVDRNLALQEYNIVVKDEEEGTVIKEGFTCFQLLSKMELAFRSKDTKDMTLRQKLIYHMLPDEGYESELELDGAGNNSFKSTRDIESGQSADDNNTPKSTFSRINYAVWKFSKDKNYAVWKLLAKDFKCVGKIWDQKKKHKYAEHLAKWLVEIDQNWKRNYRITSTDQRPLTLVRDFPSNVTEKRKEIELRKRFEKKEKFKKILERKNRPKPKSDDAQNTEEKDHVKETNDMKDKDAQNTEEKAHVKETNDMKNKETKWETPLFLAAASGIKEVVEIILENNPDFIYHVNKEGLNILHLAIKHRQLEIYEYIKGNEAAFQSLRSRISNNDGRTILHQAASMDYYREQALPGVAYQLQNELKWYHRVESIVPKHFLMHCDNESLTPGDLLDVEHAEMHDQAKQWMKETAQSCSTVAVLIAGVVFAAAYTIPGGTKKGKAELLNTPAFQFFTAMDVMALACSLGSVVMFLSILTSSFDLWDFHKSLPRKLKFGFIMLVGALIATILAFAATIVLTVHMEGNKKTTTIIYSLAFMVVSVFGLTQFPIYKMIEDKVKQCTQRWKKLKATKQA